MNQQRSRRFRSVQEARDKAEEREAGIAMFEGMSSSLVDLAFAYFCSSYGTYRERRNEEQEKLGLQCNYTR